LREEVEFFHRCRKIQPNLFFSWRREEKTSSPHLYPPPPRGRGRIIERTLLNPPLPEGGGLRRGRISFTL